jgi:hypothetical protein
VSDAHLHVLSRHLEVGDLFCFVGVREVEGKKNNNLFCLSEKQQKKKVFGSD